MKKFDFYISYLCGSHCKFCCVLDKITWFKDNKVTPHLPLDDVKEILDRKHRDGFTYVTLTGGEPTLHPDFTEILAHAKNLNMRVSVNSNMAMFADMNFCRATLPLIDEIVASIHGHSAKLHNAITGAPKSFQKFSAAMKNIDEIDTELYLITDTVLVTENIGHVSKIVTLLLSIPKLRHVLFSNINLPPEKLGGREHLVPTLPEVEAVLPEIVDRIAVRENKILRFYGVPFCTLKDYHAFSSDLYFEPKKVIERVNIHGGMEDREYTAPKPVLAKKKTEKCKPCIYFNTCGGFFNSYYAQFGDEHIQPILKS